MDSSEISLTGPGEPTATLDLRHALEGDQRFRRDSRLGAILHPGKISFREISATNSLHVLIERDRVSAHVDEISPLVIRPDGSCRYSWGRVVAHNLVVVLTDFGRRLRGHAGRQRCNLRCQAEWVQDDAPAPCR